MGQLGWLGSCCDPQTKCCSCLQKCSRQVVEERATFWDIGGGRRDTRTNSSICFSSSFAKVGTSLAVVGSGAALGVLMAQASRACPKGWGWNGATSISQFVLLEVAAVGVGGLGAGAGGYVTAGAGT